MSEDIVHDFFVELKTMEFPDYIEYPTTWVLRCCDNAAKNKIKRNKREIATTSEDIQSLIEQNTTNDDIEYYGYYSEKLELLDKETSYIIKKHIFEGYTLKEISIETNINYATVRQKYARGVKKLKSF